MNNIEIIRKAVIEANPNILELKSGCQIRWTGQGADDGIFLGFTRDGGCICYFGGGRTSETHSTESFQKYVKILGRPIRLADVLAAIFTSWNTDENIKKRPLDDDSYTELFENEREIVIKVIKRWNTLEDDLSKQTPDTLEFLALLLKGKQCDICGGSGEITTMEPVYPNEPHMAPIGTRVCICKKKQHEK